MNNYYPCDFRMMRGSTLFLTVILLTLSGCQGVQPNHQKNVNKAESRWKDARGSLLLQAAQRQFDAGDLKQATKTLGDAINYDPTNAKLHLLAGRISLEHGHLERCFLQLEMAAQLDSKLSGVPYYQGLVQQRWQKYELARDFYVKASELEADNVAYVLAVAEMELSLHQEDAALQRLLAKVKYFDQNAGIRVAVAGIYRMQMDYINAISYYHQANLLAPDALGILEELANTLVDAGRSSQAAEVYEQLLLTDEYASRIDVQYSLARCYENRHVLTKARNLYDQIRQRHPQEIEAWIGLGNVALKQQDMSTALMAGSRLQSLVPDRHEGYLIAGLCWYQRGQAERAAQMFSRAAQLMPESAQPFILQGLSLEQLGKFQAAAQAYAQAIGREPEDQRARDLLMRLSAVTP